MNNDLHKHPQHASGFFYRESVIRWILRIFYLCCAVLLAMDFLFHRHTETDIEKVPTFYAIYGFLACAVIITIAKWVRAILMRADDYYDKPENPQEFLQKQDLVLPVNSHQNSSKDREPAQDSSEESS